ncbi:MAG: hypothetical protein ABI791_15700 [Acidobacteriota bacterium]
MKRVLIITYCYPPANAISAYRPKSFADNFPENGLYPVIVTRHWDGTEKTWLDYEKPDLTPPKVTQNDKFTLIQLPYEAREYRRFKRIRHISVLRKGFAFLYSLLGRFQIHNNAIESYETFLFEYLRENPVDYIFATCDPINIALLGDRLSKKFNIPLVIDFRDLWNNKLLSSDYRPSLNERFINFCYESYLARWLQRASFVTAVTEPINEEVRRISPKTRTLMVTNGFETDVFRDFTSVNENRNQKFTFSIIGTLFPEHDLSTLILGMTQFLSDKDLSTVQLNLIGTAGIPEIRDMFLEAFPVECTRLTERIPRGEALEIMKHSDVLFHAGWRNYRGIASGKVFEYLGAHRNILIAPGDKDIMEQLVTTTGAGKIANSPEEFASTMNSWYCEWQANGFLEYFGDSEKINVYSRENQAKILATEILKIG